MKIATGLFDNMVLQRGRGNVSDAHLAGVTAATGCVVATVRRGRRVCRGLRALPVGRAARGRFAGRLRGLPAGGPYDVELAVVDPQGRVCDGQCVRNVLVGDVWLLGGQSNMEGIGYLRDRARPQPLVRAFYMHDRWGVARDPIHNLGQAVDAVHADLNGGALPQRAAHVGVGPGVAFGQAMWRRTGVPQGLIACAHGGTSMAQWAPAKKAEGSKSLYGAMLRRFRKNGARVAGVVWYQGESDANPTDAPLYAPRMQTLVRSLRRDLGAADLPVVMVQIARVTAWRDDGPWNSIQDQQRRLPRVIRNLAVVPAVDLALDDIIHISGRDQNRLGDRLAQAMAALKGLRGAGKLPIELHSITARTNPFSGCVDLFVRYRNVMGRLESPGLPIRFDLVQGGRLAQNIVSADLRGDMIHLRTGLIASDLPTAFLHYGYGTDPNCNIRDAAGRSLPVFGPVPCGARPVAVTPCVRDFRVSRTLPPVRDIRALACPRFTPAHGLGVRKFPEDFCDLHRDVFACAPRDALIFFIVRIRCAEDMRLKAGLGYDGPVKFWMDRRARFTDPAGTNPGTMDKATIPLVARKGEHEIVIALGANFGRAWGLSLRFFRTDVPARVIRAEKFFAMPEVVLPR